MKDIYEDEYYQETVYSMLKKFALRSKRFCVNDGI